MLTDSQIKKIKPTEGKTAPDKYIAQKIEARRGVY